MFHMSHHIVYDTTTYRAERTKMEILTERHAFLREEAAELESLIEGYYMTDCGLTCSGCGEVLETEGDFAAHFIVTDEKYLNLGSCPNSTSVVG